MGSECGPRTVWVVAALILVTALLALGYLVTLERPANTAHVGTAGRTHPPATATPRTSAAAYQAPHGVRAAVAAFLTAWSTPGAAERQAALADTVTTTLAAQLSMTDAADIPAPCQLAGNLTVADQTPGAVLVTVPTGCEGILWLGLQVDEAAPHGWQVTAVGKERSWIQ